MHTKGPWTRGASLISNWTREKQDKGERITEIALVRENRGQGPQSREEYEANADLLTAAPKLLAALERLEDRVRNFGGVNPHFDWQEGSDDRQMMDEARTAIREAKEGAA